MTWWPLTASNRTPRPRRLAPLAALLLAASAQGCGPSRADLESDRGRLREALDRDAQTSRTLHRADQAMALSELAEAQRLVLGEAKPAASENMRRAEALFASTDWGKARKGELSSLLGDRSASLDEYAAAMASGDAQRVLDALERQRDIERRALALTRSLEQLPLSRFARSLRPARAHGRAHRTGEPLTPGPEGRPAPPSRCANARRPAPTP